MDLKKTTADGGFEGRTVEAARSKPVHPAASNLLNYLESLVELKNDWDGEGSLKPDDLALMDAKFFVKSLFQEFPQTRVEQACPGQSGEIVIELRNGAKSLEFLFYPNKKWKYVSVGGKRPPEQGIFEQKNLSKLITWLHETD